MFQIDLKNRKSIYEQVIDNFKELILIGVIESDSKIPSVRDLSKQITVNPNTVQKAYRELERQGYIYTVSGVGTFATPVKDLKPDKKLLRDIEENLKECLKELLYLGLSKKEIEKIMNDLLKDGITRINDKKVSERGKNK